MADRLLTLLPHRPPMLLLGCVIDVSDLASHSVLEITKGSSFFVANKGVPSWIGLEYMGQTAALIAGFQLEQGTVEPHLGFLLGTRKYKASVPWFREGEALHIKCAERAVVGGTLANFDCSILCGDSDTVLAQALLSVMRKPIDANP